MLHVRTLANLANVIGFRLVRCGLGWIWAGSFYSGRVRPGWVQASPLTVQIYIYCVCVLNRPGHAIHVQFVYNLKTKKLSDIHKSIYRYVYIFIWVYLLYVTGYCLHWRFSFSCFCGSNIG